MIRQKIIYRNFWDTDRGTKNKPIKGIEYEYFEDFVIKITRELDDIHINPKTELIGINYPNDKLAVITYIEKEPEILYINQLEEEK